MVRLNSLAFLMGLIATCASAEDITTAPLSRAELEQRIIAAGTSASDGRRTGVEIDGCMITTYVHQPYQDHGWVLHSLFEFDLGQVKSQIGEKSPDGTFFLDDMAWGFAVFEAIPPYVVPHEMPEYRNPKNPIRKSEREGVVDYVWIENKSFLIIMENEPGPEKVSDFARGLMRLRAEFCLPSMS
ncbi:MAG: hypothetical protein MRY77_04565 [Rhodobacteraceae bacterium]|nr:hypothetical protein [Paracoccaceae bacterium]